MREILSGVRLSVVNLVRLLEAWHTYDISGGFGVSLWKEIRKE